MLVIFDSTLNVYRRPVGIKFGTSRSYRRDAFLVRVSLAMDDGEIV